MWRVWTRVQKASELSLSVVHPLFIMFAEKRRTVDRSSAHWMFQIAKLRRQDVIFLPVVEAHKWMNFNECKDGRMTTDIIYNDCKEANDSTGE